ncbi:MAG: DUF1540 domain-containing protein [Niameybacter sp.]
MPQISCTVESCHYNSGRICQAETLHVGGQGASITEATYCESYTNKHNAHNAVEQVAPSGQTCKICCDVNTCANNRDCLCSLEAIEVSSLEQVNNYAHTDCLSFECRSY